VLEWKKSECWKKVREKLACGLSLQNHLSNPIFSNTLFHFFSWQTHSPSLLALPFTRLSSAWARTMEAFTAMRPLAASWFASLTNSTTPKSFAAETLRFGSSLLTFFFPSLVLCLVALRKSDIFWGLGCGKSFLFFFFVWSGEIWLYFLLGD